MLKSQREPEEKKIPYMGHLLASVAFDPQVSAPMAHQLVKAAERLTYRQLCLLKLAVVKQAFELLDRDHPSLNQMKQAFGAFRDGDYRGQGTFTRELYQVLYEGLDLYLRGFINFGGTVAFGPTDIVPGKMTIQGLGGDLFNLMKLGAIPNEDLLPIVQQLR